MKDGVLLQNVNKHPREKYYILSPFCTRKSFERKNVPSSALLPKKQFQVYNSGGKDCDRPQIE